MEQRRLRVCLDARLQRGVAGGVEQGIIGLVSGLARIAADDAYYLLTLEDADEWIAPYAGPTVRLVPAGRAARPNVADVIRRAVSERLPIARDLWRQRPSRAPLLADVVPASNGVVESLSVDVMHFTFQDGFVTDVPSIYQPWDLQHVHLPEFFTSRERAMRELSYDYLCRQATIVVVASEWTRRDIVSHFGLPPEKVHVIPVGPLVELFPVPDEGELRAVQRRHDLPEQFAVYPAQTFPHKNHIALLEALALLRDRDGIHIALVCPGRLSNHYPKIKARMRELRIEGSIQFLGYVDPSEMSALYRLARCVIFPSKFEGWGMPIHEAFHAGAPVVCSTATSLPEVAGDAAVFFEPDDVEGMATAVGRVWMDAAIRADLSERGARRVREFTLERTARAFRTRYHLVAGLPLTQAEQAAL